MQEPSDKLWPVELIADKAFMSVEDVKFALFFMDDLWVLGGYQNEQDSKYIRKAVAIREAIMDRTKVEDFLEEQELKKAKKSNGSTSSILDSLLGAQTDVYSTGSEKPTVLYKYRSINTFSMDGLKNKKVWYSKPSNLNDPHDLSSKWKAGIEDKKIIEGYENLFNHVGVLSLSSSPLVSTMWSHYADSCKGFCMGFEFHESNILGQLSAPVNYTNKPPIPSMRDFHNGLTEELLTLIAFTKSTEWEQEKEWRVLKQKGGALYPYPGKLKEIIFGLNMPEAEKKKIKCMLMIQTCDGKRRLRLKILMDLKSLMKKVYNEISQKSKNVPRISLNFFIQWSEFDSRRKGT